MKKRTKSLIAIVLTIAMLVPSFTMIIPSAANRTDVELAFNNIFVFEDWITNSLSSTVIADGVPNKGGKLESNFAEGSFTLTKTDMAAGEIYTAFSMGTTSASENSPYYMMSVEPNTTYIFEYNVEGNIWEFQPFVFMYTTEGLFDGLDTMVSYATPGYGLNSFKFTTPSDVDKIQIRFTIGDDSGSRDDASVYATVKDIAIYKAEIYDNYLKNTYNLFDLEAWANNEKSSALGMGAGEISPDLASGTIRLTTEATANNTFLTGFGIDANASNDAYYTINVQPSTSYTLTYDIGDNNLPGAVHSQPYIVEMDSSGKMVDWYNYETPQLTGNRREFTTKANTARIQVVFSCINNTEAISRYCVLENIGVYKTDDLNANYSFSTVAGHAHRKAFVHGTGTYGILPTPANVPEGYVFADWFTGKDGSGIRITPNTEILPSSYTVYPKYEPAVDTLTVAQMPAKTTYTVGEKFNPTGLVLNAVIGDSSLAVSSGYYCTPEYLNTVGTQTISVRYGGKTVTFTVNVTDGDEKSITVNGAAHPVKVANNKYTIEYSATPFNRYELTYYSDSYVKGVITMDADTEVFFLEPSNNGYFASYIDSFLRGVTHYSVISIEFTCLDKEFGNFELYSVSTINMPALNDPTQYYQNDEYKVGISLDYGGVVSEIYDLKNMNAADPVVVRVYNENGKDVTRVDHRSILNRDYGSSYKAESLNVNLINTNDRGRYLQQSYYGTDQPPFEMGDYNGVPWPYNPVQGGNINHFNPVTGEVIKGGEASKVIDYRITDKEIYIKTRPLDWGKNSEDYPDSYVTDSYMEAWYVFEDGMIKTYCRFVDFSGYPSNTRDQELPALYTIEPLNNFVYHAGGEAWSDTNVRQDKEEPEFWGVLPEYNALLQEKGKPTVDVDVDCNENWAAFTASPDPESFGIGVYSAGVTDFHYGVFPAIYNEDQVKQGNLVENYRHAASLDPAIESPTSYISPIGVMTFESYKPIEYSYYVTTGTEEEIREDFRFAVAKDEAAAVAETKIAVPETVYMTPANGASTLGQYYVNNILDVTNYYDVKTVSQRDDKMYFGVHVDKATSITVSISNVTNPSDDINLVDNNGTSCDGATLHLNYSAGTGIFDEQYNLKFAGTGLKPGEMATAKWTITATLEDGTTATYTAFTVLYAPGRTVGAVAEARRSNNDNNETGTWITGATSMKTDSNGNHQLTPIGGWEKGDPIKSGYFKQDPLVYPNAMNTTATAKTADDHINEAASERYVMQTAVQSNDHSRARSYLGVVTIDKSRYSNTNQIPNLKIGFDVLLVTGGRNDSLKRYDTMYTLGTAESFNPSGGGDQDIQAQPSGWSTEGTLGRINNWKDTSYSTPFRQTVIPNYAVSDDIDGKYIHAFSQGLANYLGDRTYGTSVASVLIEINDKSELRDLVTEGYTRTETTPDFDKILENAATVLGDPSSTQEEIDETKKELADALTEYFVLRYDNIFSAYEMSQYANSMHVVGNRGTASYKDGKITIVNDTITDDEAYTEYGSANHFYKVSLKPNTEYVFEYDVTTNGKSQAFMFFYKADGSGGDVPTNISVQTNGGAWQSKTESNPWWGNYGNEGTFHYVIKFTTGANTTQASFRFGNTTNDPCESTFSKIRLIEADKYYEGVTYSKTEDVYLNGQSYGALQTLTRTGYTFGGWKDAAGKTVTAADIATENKTIYSVWTEHTYTIIYKANGGSGTPTEQSNIKYSNEVTLPSSNNYTYTGYKLLGWATTPNATSAQYGPGEKVSKLTNVNNGQITLYAVWALSEINVTFDNLIDFKAWNKTAGNGTVSEVTNTGFTITCNTGAGEATSTSPRFPVTAGKEYKIEADITGNAWDVYIFFYDDKTQSGTGIDFTDGGNRYAANGGGNATQIFTAPEGATGAVIRVDSNNSGNVTKFENIRVYEYDGIDIDVTPANKYVSGDGTFGTLPTPTKAGHTFLGWYVGDTKIESTTTVTQSSTVYLKSKWVINNSALVSDTVVIDFSTPVAIKPFANDTAYNAVKDTKTFNGISADGTTYSTTTLNGAYGKFTVDGDTVTYKPTKAVSGTEVLTYSATVNDGERTTTIKSTITVVPASNVLYEEDMFVTKNSASGVAWTAPTGTTATNANQDASSSTDIYGKDSSYNMFQNYSNGTALSATLDASNRISKTLTFDFKGKGFDLNSVCGPTTGVQIVTLKAKTAKEGEKPVTTTYIVDTYYGDAAYGTLYQVPIISESGLDYNEYTVQIVASYLPSMSGALNADTAETQAVDGIDGMTVNTASVADDAALRKALAEIGMEYVLDAETVEVIWFDDDSVLNGGKGVDTPVEGVVQTAALTSLLNVVDSVRVYHPVENGDDYYPESEHNAVYYNVMDNLVRTDDGSLESAANLFAYVVGKTDAIAIVDYESIGPKDELYLAGSTDETRAVTFKIKDFQGGRVMISLRAASGESVDAKFGSKKITVASNTEMYYDITDIVTANNGTITIQNWTPDSLLSVGSVKITSGSAVTASLSSEFDLETARAMMMSPIVEDEVDEPSVPTDPENPADPDDSVNPDEPTVPEEPSSECWLIRIIKWIFRTFVKVFNSLKGILTF